MLFPFVPMCLGRPGARGRHSQAEVSRGQPTEEHFRRVRRRISARWGLRAAFEIRSGRPKPGAGGNALEERRRAWEFDPKQSREQCARKRALRKKLTGRPVHAAFSKATNSVLVAAKRCAFSSR